MLQQYPLHHVTYSASKFEVATSNHLGEDTFTRNVTHSRTDAQTDGCTDRRTDFGSKLIYPFFLKKKERYKTPYPCIPFETFFSYHICSISRHAGRSDLGSNCLTLY